MNLTKLRNIKRNWPEGAKTFDWITDEDYSELRKRIYIMVKATPEDELPIYDAENQIDLPLEDEEEEALSPGTLLRKNDRVFVKIFLDLWEVLDPNILKKPERTLEEYGLMRLKFLEHYRAWDAVKLGEDLLIHCLRYQDEAKAMRKSLMEEMLRKNPPPDDLTNPMVRERHMNMLKSMVEEIVTRTVVYREPETGAEKPVPNSERMEQEYDAVEEITDRIIARMMKGEAGFVRDKSIPLEEPF